MKPHVRNYLKHFGYDESDRILCEYCGSNNAVDVHHLEPRSSFGSKRKKEQDEVTNLIALCRFHHDHAHGSKEFKLILKEIILKRMDFT